MKTPLTCLSYNVRSLGLGKKGVRKRSDIRNYLKNAEPRLEIILLQETHFGIRDCLTSTSQLHLKGGKQFWNEARYSAATGKYTRGTAIIVAERLVPFIEEHGVIIGSRAQYITFRFSSTCKIGVVNIYRYNQPEARTQMWRSLALWDIIAA